jgi:SAM-dependent methyltransferase
MSVFSSVDASDNPEAAVDYLDRIAGAQRGMKHYAAAAHAGRRPQGFVLDVGCGAGHDMILLQKAGLRTVGIDPSLTMVHAAARRGTSPLIQAAGEQLPFRARSLAGCRIERVLIHVEDPVALLSEVAGCLTRGALLTVFEPDWSRYLVRDDGEMAPAAWLAPVRHADAGSQLWGWVEAAGFVVLDRVEELSVWRSFNTLRSVIDLDGAIARGVADGRVHDAAASAWHARQAANHANGEFLSLMPKVQIVAERSE